MSSNKLQDRELGEKGEALICQKLVLQNWTILAKNFRCIGAEVDIIAKKGSTIIGVEVKTRKNSNQASFSLPSPEQLVPTTKINRVKKGLLNYLSKYGEDYQNLRVDLAIVQYLKENPTHPPKIKYYVGIAS